MSGIDEILDHLNTHGVYKKDLHSSGTSAKKKAEKSSFKRIRNAIRQTIDLHGLREEDAVKRLRNAVTMAVQNGVTELLVIHGYGLHSDPLAGPVLKRMVAIMLDGELSCYVRQFRPADAKDGGMGATLAILKHTP